MITIKPIELNDVNILYDLIERNRVYLKKNFPVTIDNIKDIESAHTFVKAKIDERKNKSGFYFLIKYNNVNCGIISIKNIDWRTPKAELAYFIDEKFQGKGIATQSLKEAINYSFNQLKLQKLYACIDSANVGSKSVIIKNGFILEGILRNNFRNGYGKVSDSEYYGLLNNN